MRPALFAVFLSACAVTPRALPDAQRHAPPDLKLAVDWQKAGDEAVQVLADYLRVDTTNPPGNESDGARFLAEVLAKEGIESELIEFAPDRGSLVARVKGSGKKKPLCLLSHIDVASAEPERWPEGKGPLSGAVVDGMIWGRGALDMKGLGALELMTLVWLKRLDVPLDRDVVLVAVADEEVDNKGMQQLVDEHWDRIGCSHLINEGGLGIRGALFENQTIYTISIAEKGLLWARVIATGEAGHGSVPRTDRSPDRLVEALQRIRKREVEAVMHPSLRVLFREVGVQQGGMTGFVLSRPTLTDWFVEGRLMSIPGTRAALTNTCQVTGFSGQFEPNVVPSEVTATLDCRLLPGVEPAAFADELRRIIDDEHVRLEVLQSEPATESPWDDELFAILARRVVDGRDDVAVGPILTPGFTDSKYARPKGVRAYGFVPFEVTEEEASTMHGHGERVSVDNVHRGLKLLVESVVEFAGAR